MLDDLTVSVLIEKEIIGKKCLNPMESVRHKYIPLNKYIRKSGKLKNNPRINLAAFRVYPGYL